MYVWQSSQIVEVLAEALLVLQIPHVVSDGARTTVRVLLDRPIMELPLLLQDLQGLGRVIHLPERTLPRVDFDQFLKLFWTIICSSEILELLFGYLELLQTGFVLLVVLDDLPVRKLDGRPIRYLLGLLGVVS